MGKGQHAGNRATTNIDADAVIAQYARLLSEAHEALAIARGYAGHLEQRVAELEARAAQDEDAHDGAPEVHELDRVHP